MAQKSYKTNWPLEHNGKRFETGETVRMDEDDAKPLLGGALSEPESKKDDGKKGDKE